MFQPLFVLISARDLRAPRKMADSTIRRFRSTLEAYAVASALAALAILSTLARRVDGSSASLAFSSSISGKLTLLSANPTRPSSAATSTSCPPGTAPRTVHEEFHIIHWHGHELMF